MSPSELDLLCEHCGYVLNNLPADGRCPECGALIAESSPSLRVPSLWEQSNVPAWHGFLQTTWQVIFHPTRFFRSLAIYVADDRSSSFAILHCLLASILFGFAAEEHFAWLAAGGYSHLLRWPVRLAFSLVTFASLYFVTGAAARLTHWEASFRGLRMPIQVVRRGLRYHSAHYMPVAILSCLLVFSYTQLLDRRLIDASQDLHYLYALSGAVIVGAAYLFHTYWIGMRNLMYANRQQPASSNV